MSTEKTITAEHVKALRESRDWTQQQLADELGVDQATVSRIENGLEPRGPVKRLLERMIDNPSAKDAA
ncbi:helix-turn-helix domain-containing protein [Mesorhizobium sp. M1005]|uniref:helix-turn-helix domain-containing protein n=1 Tax=unclassified Mesorhizobium TaxID=325217 RepID=UPI003337AF43